jgi:hypothetical protein
MLILTNSSIAKFSSCPRAYHWCYVQLVRPATSSPALAMGSAFHKVAEVGTDKAIDGLLDQQAATVRAMAHARSRYLPPQEASAIEQEYTGKVPGMRGVRLSGKVDAIRADDGGVHDDKTTGAELDEAVRTQRHAIQWPIYQHLTGSTAPVTIDYIKKPTIRLKKTETSEEYRERAEAMYDAEPDRFFRRDRFEVPIEAVQEALATVAWTARAVRQCGRQQYWPRRHGPGCRHAYGWCEYRSLCWDNNFEGYERKQRSHEELEVKA